MEMDPSAIRNFRDFLQLYNKMSETCFARCIDNINSRNLTENEIACVEDCSAKFVKFNNKLMQNFVKAQTEIVNKRVEESEKQRLLDDKSQSQLEQSHLESKLTVPEKENKLMNSTVQTSVENTALDHTGVVISK